MRSIGLDFGDRRIGVAVSDALGVLATPLKVLEHTDDAADISAIVQIIRDYGAGIIIVGLPRTMDGTIGPQAEKVQKFADRLREQSPVPVEYRDERLTTASAKRMLEEAGVKRPGKHRRIDYDAAAAAIILQSYLNETRPIEWPPEESH